MPKTLTENERVALRSMVREMVRHNVALWDQQLEIEVELGGDVDDMRDEIEKLSFYRPDLIKDSHIDRVLDAWKKRSVPHNAS